MLIDAFTFYNELDLLEIRLNELYDVVDKFIIVEANKTQSLIAKPFNFETNIDRYKKFLDKIVYIKVEDCPSNDKNLWTMENFQRNCVMRGLDQIGINENDLIMISDMDEIPRASSIKTCLNHPEISQLPVYVLDNDFYVYFMNLKVSGRTWVGTSIFRPSLLSKFSIQNIKDGKNRYPVIRNSGWHFSWLGGYEKIHEKAMSCIEPLDKSTIPSLNDFKNYFDSFLNNENKKFIHIENFNINGASLEINEDISEYPRFLLKNYYKYSKYFLHKNND